MRQTPQIGGMSLCEFRCDRLAYADDVGLMAETLEQVEDKVSSFASAAKRAGSTKQDETYECDTRTSCSKGHYCLRWNTSGGGRAVQIPGGVTNWDERNGNRGLGKNSLRDKVCSSPEKISMHEIVICEDKGQDLCHDIETSCAPWIRNMEHYEGHGALTAGIWKCSTERHLWTGLWWGVGGVEAAIPSGDERDDGIVFGPDVWPEVMISQSWRECYCTAWNTGRAKTSWKAEEEVAGCIGGGPARAGTLAKDRGLWRKLVVTARGLQTLHGRRLRSEWEWVP